jgi:hypothetical protein
MPTGSLFCFIHLLSLLKFSFLTIIPLTHYHLLHHLHPHYPEEIVIGKVILSPPSPPSFLFSRTGIISVCFPYA